MQERATQKDLELQGQEFVSELKQSARDLENLRFQENKVKTIMSFLDILTPWGQDEQAKFDFGIEVIQTLKPNEKLAYTLTEDFGGKFNRNFGIDSFTPTDFDDRNLQDYFTGIGVALSSLLGSQSHVSENFRRGLTTANEAYYKMWEKADSI